MKAGQNNKYDITKTCADLGVDKQITLAKTKTFVFDEKKKKKKNWSCNKKMLISTLRPTLI